MGTLPIDLGTMGWKMKRKGYSSPIDVKQDILKIFQNCKLYYTDPSSHPRKCAAEMDSIFHERWNAAGIDAGWNALHPSMEPPVKDTLPKIKLTNVPSKEMPLESSPPPAALALSADAPVADAPTVAVTPAAETEGKGSKGSLNGCTEAENGAGQDPEGTAVLSRGPNVPGKGDCVKPTPEETPAAGGDAEADKPSEGGLKLKINFGGQPSEKRPRTE